MRAALIGIGRWGANIKKTLESFSGVEVLTFDKSTLPSPRDLDPETPIVVATPGSTHAAVALPFITAGHPVFIEKPMTTTLRDALRVQKAAKKSGAPIFVGHIHLYNPAFLKAKELVKGAGTIRSAVFEGMNWGPFRDDMSAMWDWMPHDIAMALELFGKPTTVQAWGTYDTAIVHLFFKKTSAIMHISSLSPVKKKSMTIVGTKYTVILDDTQPKNKVAQWTEGKTKHIAYDATMPLTAELKAFLGMAKTGKKPKTDVTNGVEVVRVLAAAEKSINLDGKRVRL